MIQTRSNKLFDFIANSTGVILLLISCNSVYSQSSKTKANASVIHLADPTIFYDKKTFYLYGTVEGASGNGFITYTSGDLQHWKRSSVNDGYVLKKGDAYGSKGFWAPQVFLFNSKFNMAYVANENIAIAESDNPAGPFMQKIKDSLPAEIRQIDPFVFIDDDGKKYLYHVRLTNGNRIFVAEMTDDLSAIKPSTLRECIAADEQWENTADAKWPVAEGPSIIKRNGVYYLFYTANDFRNPDYAVGYATSSSPLGPWKKFAGNPIISRELLGANGTGHGDFFYDHNKLYYVFHTHNSVENVAPRKTAIIEVRFNKSNNGMDTVVVDKKTFRFLTSIN